MNIVEYGKARDLIEQIERQQLEVESRLQVIEKLKVDLNTTLQQGDARLRDSIGAAATASAKDEIRLSVGTRPSVQLTPQPVVTAKAPKAAKRGMPTNGEKSQGRPAGRITLGDMVRDILIDAGKPLKHTEIRDALKARNYTNSAPDQFKTLGVRLHRLQKRGVRNIGKGYFDLTDEWKTRLDQQSKALAKQQAREESKLAKA
jgi:hypothetical protein